jgi:hypothetical protein
MNSSSENLSKRTFSSAKKSTFYHLNETFNVFVKNYEVVICGVSIMETGIIEIQT